MPRAWLCRRRACQPAPQGRRAGALSEPSDRGDGTGLRGHRRVDTDLLIAALLHDAIEDSGRTEADLTAAFGARVARIVAQNSDDMTLPKPERKARRIAAMADKPVDARIVKIADLISNLRAIDRSPPAGWTVDWRLGYLDGCKALVDAGRAPMRRWKRRSTVPRQRSPGAWAMPGRGRCAGGRA
ncbi:MAG: bifunctional (p)ppGpp synthetase/guanosine-3',5'-bis(diphosphate) 3'-pyrophosphohydrolase [Rhodobacteraceae bacterium]|nr:bifunctional (p)ppGpp synthetase/guanosine-3',5'-bis(diphosphate) 3'-pyrophosphohydrolase [Paracoccaceae bacterium]